MVRRCELKLPDFDLPGITPTASSWLVELGARVVEGDRLIEITVGEVTVDLSAPASGTFARRCVRIDQPLETGQLLACIDIGE